MTEIKKENMELKSIKNNLKTIDSKNNSKSEKEKELNNFYEWVKSEIGKNKEAIREYIYTQKNSILAEKGDRVDILLAQLYGKYNSRYDWKLDWISWKKNEKLC